MNGIDQVMTVIARGFLFDDEFVKEPFDKDGLITDRAESDIRNVLSCWCGFVEKEEVQSSNALKKWLINYPDADGWLETYWKFWYEKNKKKKDGEEQWNKIVEKWSNILNTGMDIWMYGYLNILSMIRRGPCTESREARMTIRNMELTGTTWINTVLY